MKLANRLLLFDYLSSVLGGDFSDLADSIRKADVARRPDGHTHYLSVLESRGARVQLERSQLFQYDSNIVDIENSLGRNRPGFRLTYFQYLALLYTEVFLHKLTDKPATLLADIQRFRKENLQNEVSAISNRDLEKVALWMATGSGKTLMLHANLMQFRHYAPFVPDNTVLLTPSETLSNQHKEEFGLSGIPAHHAVYDTAGSGVQVIEMTKLFVDDRGSQSPRGGVSLPTSVFEGRNLLLVDEGHKGSTTRGDQEEERKWRAIRREMAGDGGFSFEYSATFAQITEDNDEMLDEYAKSIVFDYGYRRFWEDGYGKDYAVVNLKDAGGFDQDELLLAGLLVLYEQLRLAADKREKLVSYNVEQPLMAFVGSTVTGKVESEVVQVVEFLNRVLEETDWARGRIEALLDGSSGLPSDLFSHRYPYLASLGESPSTVFDDLRDRVFHGRGPLTLHLLRRADGEIGLRTADAKADRYCGVINVGSVTGLLRKCVNRGIREGEDDHFTESAFRSIEDPDSPIRLLVGSRKFIEGWSSWRVSVMGLLKVGKSAGPQVIQLFGRGVRLKGLNFGLRRSRAIEGEHPRFMPLLETLFIFGLEANYMQTFNEAIRREGVEPPADRHLPIRVRSGIDAIRLQVPDSGKYDFFSETVVPFDSAKLAQPIVVDLMPSFEVVRSMAPVEASGSSVPSHEGAFPFHLVDAEDLFLDLVAYKRRRGWHNIYVSREAVTDCLRNQIRLIAPRSLFELSSEGDLLYPAARDGTRRALERFVYSEQRRHEGAALRAEQLRSDHPNFPSPAGDLGSEPAYRLQVPRPMVREVDSFLKKYRAGSASAEDLKEPLPRMHVDEHLYTPLLVKESDVDGRGKQLGLFHEIELRSTPSGLVESEVVFLRDLRAKWASLSKSKEWAGYSLYLLRNLPRRGVGFFKTAGFYPDFLIWLKKGDNQALAFVEPHGLVIWDEMKVELLKDIRRLGLSIPTVAWIVTQTAPKSVGAIGGGARDADWYREQHILFQHDESYIDDILDDLRRALDASAAITHPAARTIAQSYSERVVGDEDVDESERFVHFLPVYSLEAAAGRFGTGRKVEREGWIRVEGRLSEDLFVVRAKGYSMEPRIRDEDLCVFRRYKGGSRQGLIVLAQWAGPEDPETGGAYAIKKYSREKRVTEERREGAFVVLSSINPDYSPIIFDAESEADITVLAEFRRTLKPPGH